ncbi:TRAP transporter substrate-binding protein [Nesterenkonia sp. HG001]|uniref:TRAP transporter substrate-binding protein n=1 Tax=Nesterenkonia sp. HG001 TaxID=2983207 RepID=UPI002AC3A9A4|nr:TRAP transporter substrate-binding protein [Nesterenkonia sp. HG001]MDZ5077681.1 TRAP transporter substrate-binding protein [Nesterenkonia sp. HG001]
MTSQPSDPRGPGRSHCRRSPRRPRGLRATAVLGVLALTAGLASCGTGADAEADDSRRLLLGHGAEPGNPRSLAAEHFSERVAEETDGRIEAQVLGQESLGSDSDMMVSVASGTLDMSVNSQGPFSPVVPEANLVGLPFLFENSEHAYEVIDGEAGDHLAAEAEERGYHVLAWWDNGVRDITNSTRPIEDVEDLRGLQIRTPDDPMTIDIFRSLGASPTPMAFGELYLGLRQGAVDGQENPVVNIHSSSLHEVQDHLAVTGHKYELNPFVISTQTWATLDEEDQELLSELAIEARDHQRALMQKQTEEIYSEYEDTLEVTHPDREAFREATGDVYESWRQEHPEFYELITEAAEQTRATHEEDAP